MDKYKLPLGIIWIEYICKNCQTLHKICVSGAKKGILEKLLFQITYKPKKK